MNERIWIQAAPGRTVPDPADGQIVPSTPIEVERNSYWIRRLADNDVLPATPPKTNPRAAAPKE